MMAFRKTIFANGYELESVRVELEPSQLCYLVMAGFKKYDEDYILKTKKITIKFHRLYY